MLKIKRAYESAMDDDGFRILVDRMWPRGQTKEKARIDLWAKAITPSPEIRDEFCHIPEKFPAFKEAYGIELDHNSAMPEFLKLLEEHLETGNVTLIYGAKDEVHNHAVVLRDYIVEKLKLV